MKKIFILILAVFIFSFSSQVNAQFYLLYQDYLNTTTDWNIVTANGAIGASQTSVYIDYNTALPTYATKSDNDFFFSQPFNKTTLGYLGASIVHINFTMKPDKARGTCAGACSIEQGVRAIRFNQTGAKQIYLEFIDNGADIFRAVCDATAVTISSNTWTTDRYNISIEMNMTNSTTQIITQTEVGNQYAKIACPTAMFTSSVQALNKSLILTSSGTSGSGSGIDIGSYRIHADLDADYYNSGNPYSLLPEESVTYENEGVNLSFHAPIPVNASYSLDGGSYISLCSDCQVHSELVDISSGNHNITYNYTFNKADITFSNIEFITFSTVGEYAPCGENPTASNKVIEFNFKNELSNSTSISSNYTFYLDDLSGNRVLTNLSAESTSFSICTLPTTPSQELAYTLFYVSADGSYPIRQLNNKKININITNPLIMDAWLLTDAQTDNYVITLQDKESNKLGNYIVEAVKISGVTNIIQLVNSYITGATTGQTVHPLDLTTIGALYNFKIYSTSGDFVYETGYHALTSTSEIITVLTDLIKTPEIINQLESLLKPLSSLLFNENTRDVTLSYDDSHNLTSLNCLQVYNSTIQSHNLIGLNCTTNRLSTLTFNIPPPNITYVAYYTITSAEDNNNYTLLSLDISLLSDYQIYGDLGLFFELILIFMIMGALLSRSVALIIGVTAIHALVGFSGFTAISPTAIGAITVMAIMGAYFIQKHES